MKIPTAIKKTKANKRKPRKRRIDPVCVDAAQLHAGALEKGVEICGLTNGSFSVIDLIDMCLCCSGPADIVIATWTASAGNISRANDFLKDGRVKSLRFLVDGSFMSRQPAYCQELIDFFGRDSIRTIGIHAKFALIGNDDWKIVLRTSANLNLNKRIEFYDITEGYELYDYFMDLVDWIWRTEKPGELSRQTIMENRNTDEHVDLAALGIDEGAFDL